MNIGKLRHRVTVQQMTETRDTTGEVIETWTDVATRWAYVEPMRSSEKDKRGIEAVENTYKVTLRYQAGLVTTARRLVYNGQLLDIESVINVNEANTTYEVTCRGRI